MNLQGKIASYQMQQIELMKRKKIDETKAELINEFKSIPEIANDKNKAKAYIYKALDFAGVNDKGVNEFKKLVDSHDLFLVPPIAKFLLKLGKTLSGGLNVPNTGLVDNISGDQEKVRNALL